MSAVGLNRHVLSGPVELSFAARVCFFLIETTAPPGIKFWGDIVADFNGLEWTLPPGVVNIYDVFAVIKT